jgi:hypothetical protein
MSADTYAAAVARRAEKTEPFPPKELRQCQQRLLEIDALLTAWASLGKADGVHGESLRKVLHPEGSA